MTAVVYKTLTDRAAELRALAEYAYRQQIEPDAAYDVASRNWIACSLLHSRTPWDDYVAAVGRLLDLEAGLVPPSEVGVVCGVDRRQIAVDVARDDIAAALFVLLYGPEARPCSRCKGTSADLWRPAVHAGLCVQCQAVEWIGGRA